MAAKQQKSIPDDKEFIGAGTIGRFDVDVLREGDPNGVQVVHSVRRDATVVDRMFRAGSFGAPEIAGKLHQAGEQFRADFEYARLMGRFGSIDLNRSGSRGINIENDNSIAARERTRHALAALGQVPGRPATLQATAAWWIIGEQITIEAFVERMRAYNNIPMNEGKASGLVHAALERLAVHYGIIVIRNVEDASSHRGRAQGFCSAAARLLAKAVQARAKAVALRERLQSSGGDELKKLLRSYRVAVVTADALSAASRELERDGRRMMGLQPAG